MKNRTQKLVISAMLAALVCVATMLRIPSPFKGYINLGDCMVLLAGWSLSPLYAFFAAAIGSALTDLFAGYIIYAPATFVIKGVMAIAAYFVFNLTKNKTGLTPARIFGGITAELIMIGGYFLFEGFMYGFIPSAVNIPANAVQGLFGLVLGVILIKIFKKSGVI